MIAEIISIGNELLTGKITDTNSSFLARELTSLGMDCKFKATIGDIKEDIQYTIKNALKRSNIILVTGGLGPTQDDLTMESVASLFNIELIYNSEIANNIKQLFTSRGMNMPESNIKQAYIPNGSKYIMNTRGTAPGIIWDVSQLIKSNDIKLIIMFPGVPEEMKYLWNTNVKGFLNKYSSKNIYEKYVNFIGISESSLMETLSEYVNLNDTQILPYANNFQIQLRVFSENTDINIAKENVNNMLNLIQAKVGKYIYGYNNETLEYSVAKALLDKNKTVAIAEACTGGLISSRLTDIPGSSKYTNLNIVAYANDAKQNILEIQEELFKNEGSVSESVAKYMAQNIRKIAKTDIGLGITGIAGPTGGSITKPVGLVYIAIADEYDCQVFKQNINPNLDRTQIKWRFSQLSLDLLLQYLKIK